MEKPLNGAVEDLLILDSLWFILRYNADWKLPFVHHHQPLAPAVP